MGVTRQGTRKRKGSAKARSQEEAAEAVKPNSGEETEEEAADEEEGEELEIKTPNQTIRVKLAEAAEVFSMDLDGCLEKSRPAEEFVLRILPKLENCGYAVLPAREWINALGGLGSVTAQKGVPAAVKKSAEVLKSVILELLEDKEEIEWQDGLALNTPIITHTARKAAELKAHRKKVKAAAKSAGQGDEVAKLQVQLAEALARKSCKEASEDVDMRDLTGNRGELKKKGGAEIHEKKVKFKKPARKEEASDEDGFDDSDNEFEAAGVAAVTVRSKNGAAAAAKTPWDSLLKLRKSLGLIDDGLTEAVIAGYVAGGVPSKYFAGVLPNYRDEGRSEEGLTVEQCIDETRNTKFIKEYCNAVVKLGNRAEIGGDGNHGLMLASLLVAPVKSTGSSQTQFFLADEISVKNKTHFAAVGSYAQHFESLFATEASVKLAFGERHKSLRILLDTVTELGLHSAKSWLREELVKMSELKKVLCTVTSNFEASKLRELKNSFTDTMDEAIQATMSLSGTLIGGTKRVNATSEVTGEAKRQSFDLELPTDKQKIEKGFVQIEGGKWVSKRANERYLKRQAQFQNMNASEWLEEDDTKETPEEGKKRRALVRQRNDERRRIKANA